jgi:hypothetical protein
MTTTSRAQQHYRYAQQPWDRANTTSRVCSSSLLLATVEAIMCPNAAKLEPLAMIGSHF